MFRTGGITCFLTVSMVWAACAEEPHRQSAAVDFDTQIRPILSDRCFACHGPDDGNREAELRFDQRDSAMREAEYGEREFVIKPGSPAHSEIILRLTTSDADLRMPPPESHLEVTEDEIALIRRWIEEGATWTDHWAFESINPVITPQPRDNDWTRNELDEFILARLLDEGLSPSHEAPHELLARRLYFALTGLPPSVQQLEAFLNHPSANAYEKLVDDLLASSAYGERMAVDWLDVARYADTHGYQLDFEAYVWPYRDWVVSAFNQNLPFDEFITWQLAGDLLPNATREQRIATAFNRLHRQTNEGGSVNEEFRLEYVADRVDTFGVAFLGLSVGCARCHDHKFDPISQREYYQLAAFFDNIDEMGVFSYFTKATPSPSLELPTKEEADNIRYLRAEVDKAKADVDLAIRDVEHRLDDWLAQESSRVNMRGSLLRGITADFSFEEVIPIQEIEEATETAEANETEQGFPNAADPRKPATISEAVELRAGRHGKGVLFNGDNGFTTSATEEFSRHDGFSVTFWLKLVAKPDRATVFHTTQAATDAGSRGIDMVIEDGALQASLVHYWPGNAIRVTTKDRLPIGQWLHVALTYDGSSKAAGVNLFVDGQAQQLEVVRDRLTRTIRYTERDQVNFKAGNTQHQMTVGYRYRDRGLTDGMIDELKVYDRRLSAIEVEDLSGQTAEAVFRKTTDELTAAERRKLVEFVLTGDDAYQSKWQALRQARMALGSAVEPVASMMVMQELPEPRQTYLLNRGAYDAKGDPVAPGVITQLLPWSEALPSNRLGLAQWLTNPAHPLTARVAVNRIWQAIMGRGLVATQEDFGSQGTRPTHPELLDYLSHDFVENGWDVKRLVKQIVMSATFRQASDVTQDLRERDPQNELLARGPSYRLSAEMIRDGALAAGGLLVQRLGGPPVKPYQPPGLWQESMNIGYQRDPIDGSRRRSIYSYWKRTLPPPAMITLDAAKREMCEVRRHPTTTPLQALVLLNDPQYVEAARAAAEAAMLANSDTDDQLRQLYQTFTSRRPSAAQLTTLRNALSAQSELLRNQVEDIDTFLSVGDHEPGEGVDRTELAALTVVAQMIMNTDHFVTLR